MLFDTHIHLDLLTDPRAQIDTAKQHGIERFLLPGIRPESWPDLFHIVDTIDGVLLAPGVHPLAAEQWTPDVEEDLIKCLSRPEAVAIGEIGLDAKIETPVEVQECVLRDQLRIAINYELPVILHCRRAVGHLLKILNEERADRVGGILHAFTGSTETATEAIRLGFALGIGGPATYTESSRIKQMICELPQDWIVIETDAPDLSPHPHHGETNRPEWLRFVHRRLATLRNWSLDETATITTKNARRVLRLQEKSDD
jgi:TatD DNase family protein